MGKKIVDDEEIFAKTQALRQALPKSMREAEELMKRGQEIVKSAESEANRLIDTAEREAERIVTDARNKSERSVSEAKAHAERLMSDAQSRADRTVADAQAQAERTLENANAQAQRTVDEANERAAHVENDAQKRADELVAEHSITQRAQEEGEETIALAQRDSDEMRRQADDYAFEVLNKITGVLDKLSHSVEMGKESLRQSGQGMNDESAEGYGEPYFPSNSAVASGQANGYRR